MKKFLKISAIITLAVLLLCGCGAQKPEKAIVGSWFTQANGVGMTVSFSENNIMTVTCNIIDKAATDAAGVNPEIVKAKNITCYYSVEADPDLSLLTESEQELLAGKMALSSYLNEEDMKNALTGEILYFTIDGNTLTTTQRSGAFNPQTNVPEYSETVFTKQ